MYREVFIYIYITYVMVYVIKYGEGPGRVVYECPKESDF